MTASILEVFLKLKTKLAIPLLLTVLNGCAKDFLPIEKNSICGVILNPYPKNEEARIAFEASPKLVQGWLADNEIVYATICEGK